MDIPHFNNVGISYSADGIGAKGVISQQLSFNLPASEYSDIGGVFPYGTEVLLSCGLSIPEFYIHSLKPNGINITVTCYDCAMFAKETSSLTSADFDSDGYAATSAVISDICHVCGLSYISLGDVISSAISKIHKDLVIGKTARDILSGLAEAACGCFYGQDGKSLSFLPFASGAVSALFPVSKYSRIAYGLSKSCDSVIITDGSKAYSAGGSADAFHTMKIDTVYACSELAGAVISAIKGKTYTAWSCKNALVTNYPAPGAGVIFDDKELVCNFLKLNITSGGCFASMGRNDLSESEYTSEYTRELSDRVKIGETNGNTKVTRNGIKFVNENDKSKEYGFDVSVDGIAAFGGAMLNKLQPVGKIEETADNAVSFMGTLGGKKFRWTCTEALDGTISFGREEVVDKDG